MTTSQILVLVVLTTGLLASCAALVATLVARARLAHSPQALLVKAADLKGFEPRWHYFVTRGPGAWTWAIDSTAVVLDLSERGKAALRIAVAEEASTIRQRGGLLAGACCTYLQ